MKSCQLLSTGSSILAAAAKSLQSCPTLCDPIDGSPPGSPTLGIPQARTQWSALPFPSPKHKSEKWKWSRSVMSNSLRPHGSAAHQAPPSMGFSTQEYWSELPLPSPVSLLETPKPFINTILVYKSDEKSWGGEVGREMGLKISRLHSDRKKAQFKN